MSTIAENINTLYDVKEGIKMAIESKGVAVGEVPFTEYAQKIDEISVGSGDCEGVYDQGYEKGVSDTKGKMSHIVLNFNGLYKSEDGFNSVEVAVENGDGVVKFVPQSGKPFHLRGADVYNAKNIVVDCVAIDTLDYYFQHTYFYDGVPYIKNTSNVNSTYQMFEYSNIENAPLFYTGRVVNMASMFSHCEELKNVPPYDTSSTEDMTFMFIDCKKLESIPQFDTHSLENAQYMFSDCVLLRDVPQLDFSNCLYISAIFNRCEKLENLGGFTGLRSNLNLTSSIYITRESMLNIFNQAASVDPNSLLSIVIKRDVYNRLTEDDIAIITNKGWGLDIMN